MKKKLVLATIIVGTVISLTGCNNPLAKKETEAPLETQAQTEFTPLETEDNYYDETEYAYTETADTEDSSQSDQAIYNQANAETNKYRKKGDKFEVAITDPVTQKTVYADFTADNVLSGAEADGCHLTFYVHLQRFLQQRSILWYLLFWNKSVQIPDSSP